MLSIEVRLLNLDGVDVAINEWWPREGEDRERIAERIARYIVEHRGAGARILVQRDG